MKNNKVYALQLDCNDSSVYMDMLDDSIIIASKEHSRYYGYNIDLLTYIKNNIINYSGYDIDVFYRGNIASYIIDMLKSYKKISLKQALTIAATLKNNNDDNDVFIAVLNAITNKKYNMYSIRGCSQGDYAVVFYPADEMTYQYLNYIEAVYFNTGAEIMIHDSDDIPTCAEDIHGYCFYTAAYNIDDLKKEIADHSGCDAADVVLYLIADRKTVIKYIYEVK